MIKAQRGLLWLLLMVFVAMSCGKQTDVQFIVDEAIETAGGKQYTNTSLAFDFRNRHYTYKRNGGEFEYERVTKDSTGTIIDKLNNKGFSRQINGEKVELHDTVASKFENSVNSVIYFAMLPYGLNDVAVKKQYAGEATIKGEPYHKIEVTFNEEGGGVDFEDKFMYWIHQSKHTVDFFAYSYSVDGGGIRFREAFNPRVVDGIRFVDYNNYKVVDKSTPLTSLDQYFEEGKLKLLSKIVLENVTLN